MKLGIVSNVFKGLKQGAAIVLVAWCVFVLKSLGHTQTEVHSLSSTEVDQVVVHLQAAVQNYIFSDVATKLEQEIIEHRPEYLTITDPKALADRLTADMRSVGHDFHLQVTYGEEFAVKKEPSQEEQQHAHAFDLSSGYGVRSACSPWKMLSGVSIRTN